MARPRVLFVGRTRYRLPLPPALARKFRALRRRMDVKVLAAAAEPHPADDPVFDLVPPTRARLLDGPRFYLTLPFRVARRLRRYEPDAVVAESALEAAGVLLARALARRSPRLVLEVHGDWRTAHRLYGSPLRRALAPLTDGAAAVAIRHADAVRTLSPFTSGLVREVGVEPAAEFPAYVDLTTFCLRPPRPLPARPRLLFVGVLERSKDVAGLAAAWRLAAPRLPRATLHVVGDGAEAPTVEALAAELPGRVAWERRLEPREVAAAMDEAAALVLPSRTEGLPRVVMEAFCRGRPVIAARVGGVPDIVEDGVSGILVEPGSPLALAGAIVRVLGDRETRERLAAGAAATADRWRQTPDEYAARLESLVA